MSQFFGYIKLILEFWSIVKPILDKLKTTPEQERQRVANAILEASKKADNGDTSGYEDQIRRGRMTGE